MYDGRHVYLDGVDYGKHLMVGNMPSGLMAYTLFLKKQEK
jgi:hypothetical protein